MERRWSMRSRFLVAGLGGAALAVLAAWSWASCDCDKLAPDAEATRLIVGLSFVAVGMVALAHGRFHRVGILLSAVGWTWFIYDIGYIYQPLPYTFARVSAGVWQPILAHLAVGFPSGRLRSRVDRVVVLAAYALYWITSLVLVAFWHSRGPALTARNLLFIADHPHLLDAVQLISQLLVIVLAAAVLGVVVWHWRTASVPARRALDPLLWASAPLGVVVIAYALLGARYFPALLPLAMTALPAAFLVGLLRIRLDRSAVGSLVVELGQRPPPDRLQRALARTLHDPTLRVGYWAHDRQSFVDVKGLPVELPDEGSGRVATRIERDGALIAVLVHDRALREDPELIDASIAAARLALENEHLHAEVSAPQRLVTLSRALKVARGRLVEDADPAVATTLRAASQELNRALAELRDHLDIHHGMKLDEKDSAGVGYLLKDRDGDVGEFASAVPRVDSGGPVIDPLAGPRLVGTSRPSSLLDDLSERERQVLELMAQGRSNQAICRRLRLSGKTVEAHVRNIFTKLELPPATGDHRRVLAVITYLRA